MIDNTVPTTQFHPYQPPQVGELSSKPSGLNAMLRKIGITPSTFRGLTGPVRRMDVGRGVSNARSWARNNPSKSLGALAALAIGVGLMNRRRIAGMRDTHTR